MNDAVIDSTPTTDIPQAPTADATPTPEPAPPPPTTDTAPEAEAEAEAEATEPVVVVEEEPLVPRPQSQRDVINRLRRIEGQVRGLIDMVQNGRCSEDVAQQMAAARKAMDKAFYRMMTGTVIEAMCDSDAEIKTVREIERSARILEKYA